MIHTGICGCLLRSHVCRSTERDTARGHVSDVVCLSRCTERLRYTEVRNNSKIVGEHHVVRLDVAVHHAVFVRVRKSSSNFLQNEHRFVDRQLSLACQSRAQRLALDVGHREEGSAGDVAGGKKWYDVWMLQLGGELYLTAEPLSAHIGGNFGRKNLQDDLPIEGEILREENATHSTAVELALDGVAGRQVAVERLAEVAHVTGEAPPQWLSQRAAP